MHVLIVCLYARKGGLDGMGQSLQSAMVALTFNQPFNFSAYVFQAIKANALASPILSTNVIKFLLFPRFLQLMLNTQIQNVSTNGQPLRVTQMLKRTFKDCTRYTGRVLAVVPLFGHIVNPNYVAPDDVNWINDPALPPV